MKAQYRNQCSALTTAARINSLNEDLQKAAETGSSIDKNLYTALLQVKQETARFTALFENITARLKNEDNSDSSQRQQGAD